MNAYTARQWGLACPHLMRTSAAYNSTSQARRHNKAVIALQAQAFASWKDLIVYRQVKRSAMSDSIRRLLHGTLGRSFAAWSNTVHERAALKQKAATCLARLAHAHVASAFTAWLEWAAEQKEHRCATACASMHICYGVACMTVVILCLCKCFFFGQPGILPGSL